MKNKEEIISLDKQILKHPKIKIYSKLEGNKINYIVSLDSDERTQKFEERIALAKFTQGNLRILKEQIKNLLELVSEERVEKGDIDFSVAQIKGESDIELTDEMITILTSCIDKDNKDLQQISVERKTKIEDIILDFDYNKADDLLPPKDSVALSNATNETLQDVGKNAQKRLASLETIKTIEDANLYKDSLEAFMEYQETETDRGKILLTFIQKIDKLDPNTIIATLKAIEDKDIKYSKLYPIYLRIQEKRVMKKVQMYLIGLKSQKNVPDGRLEKFLELLDEQQIANIEDTDINELISNFTSSENEQVEQYIKSGRKVDFEMMRYISETKDKSEEKEEVLTYLKNRITSLRQVGKEFEKYELRTYIEDTEFKDENETEQDTFLYNVAEMEKKYLLAKYGELLERYNNRNITEPKNLEEYNRALTEKEKEKNELQELYNGYNKLVNDMDKKRNGEGRDG